MSARLGLTSLWVLVAAAHAAPPQWPQLNTQLRATYFSSNRQLDDATGFMGAGLLVKGQWAVNPSHTLRLEARALNSSLDRPGGSRSDLIEAYWSHHTERWDWRVGKQIIAWGRADGLNPSDQLSPRDTTVLLPNDADQRLGIWAIQARYAWSPDLGVKLILKADRQTTTLPLPAAARVMRPAKEAEFALKLDHVGGELDASVSYFQGHSLLPQAMAEASGALTLNYPRIEMLAADLARNFGSMGSRFEMAYVRPRQPSPAGLRPYLYAVAGIDHTFYPRLNVNLQVFLRHSGPPRLATPAQSFNAATFWQQKASVRGLSLRVANSWRNDTVNAEIFIHTTLSQTFTQALLSYALNDGLRASLGLQNFSGHGPQFGSMQANRGGFGELRWAY